MKKIASIVVFFAVALSGACVFAGDVDTPTLRLSPTKIPKCSKAHVCQNLPYGERQVGKGAVHESVAQVYDLYLPGLSPTRTARYLTACPKRDRGSTRTSENTST